MLFGALAGTQFIPYTKYSLGKPVSRSACYWHLTLFGNELPIPCPKFFSPIPCPTLFFQTVGVHTRRSPKAFTFVRLPSLQQRNAIKTIRQKFPCAVEYPHDN